MLKWEQERGNAVKFEEKKVKERCYNSVLKEYWLQKKKKMLREKQIVHAGIGVYNNNQKRLK